MSTDCFFGLDIGTSSVKGTLIDSNGDIRATERASHRIDRKATGEVTLDPASVFNAVREVFSRIDWRRYRLVAATAASFGEAFVLLDSDGSPMDEIVMYSDTRGREEAAHLSDALGKAKAYHINGCGIAEAYSLPKLMWLLRHSPETLTKACTILPVADYIVAALTGEYNVSHSLAARTMAFDIARLDWSHPILEAADVPAELFPSPVAIGSPVGTLKPELANQWGIRGPATFVAGGHDQVFAAIGAGLLSHDQVVDGLGSVECLTALVSEDADNEPMQQAGLVKVPYLPGSDPITYGYSLGGGELMSWFCREIYCGPGDADDSVHINDMIDAAAEDSAGVTILPHLNGAGTPHMDTTMSAAILGLRAHVNKSHLVRALLEAMNYEMAVNLTWFDRAGIHPKRVIATGGGSSNARALQLKADTWGMPVYISKAMDGGAVGAAIVAATGGGLFASISEGIDKWVKYGAEYLPAPRSTPCWGTESFKTYMRLHKAASQ